MNSHWITPAEAVAMISKKSHHLVSPHHVQTLVNRGKIGVRSFHGGPIFLKRSDVQVTRVAAGIGNSRRSGLLPKSQTSTN